MRWEGQSVDAADGDALPGLQQVKGLLRTVTAQEFPGVRFHEVAARSALNEVPAASAVPFRWTINPYRGCAHACVYCFARGTHAWLELDTGSYIRVRAAAEPVIEIAAETATDLLRIAWHIGNRHLPLQALEDRLRLRADHVIAAMVEGLGGRISTAVT